VTGVLLNDPPLIFVKVYVKVTLLQGPRAEGAFSVYVTSPVQGCACIFADSRTHSRRNSRKGLRIIKMVFRVGMTKFRP
jgi:hypothetical protein